jgi:hypothetical protein
MNEPSESQPEQPSLPSGHEQARKDAALTKILDHLKDVDVGKLERIADAVSEVGIDRLISLPPINEALLSEELATLTDLRSFMDQEWLPEDMDEIDRMAALTRAVNGLITITNTYPDWPPIVKYKLPGEKPEKIPSVSNAKNRSRYRVTINHEQFESMYGIDAGELAERLARSYGDIEAIPNLAKPMLTMYDEFAAQYEPPNVATQYGAG